MSLFNKKEKTCKHKFEDKFALVVKDLPRIVSVCKLCGLAVHRQIYSINKATEIENGN